MKRIIIIIILLTLILTACAPAQETSSDLPVKEAEETVVTNPTFPTEAPGELPTATLEPTATEVPTNTPIPTAEPTPTETPDLGLQPYSTDFSEANEDWEVVLSKKTTAVSQENGQYILEASGLTAAVVSSPKSIVKASELSIEVDMIFSQTGDETGGGGIVCGYAGEKAFYGIGVQKHGKEYYASISETTTNSTLASLQRIIITDSKDQQSYHLKAICSSTGLGLIIDGKKVLRYPLTELTPGRIGLYSSGGSGINSSGTAMVDMPNKVVFDNFSATTMQLQDEEWISTPIDPFEYLSIGELLYSEDFSAPTGVWTQYTDSGQTVKLENGKLSLSSTSVNTMVYSKLESLTWFASGVMMETDFTVVPGSPEFLNIGFLCDVDGNWNNLYAINLSGGGTTYLKYSNGSWLGIGSSNNLTGEYEPIETGRTYHLTGICGSGYLGLIVDGAPQFFMPIPEQKFHSVGLRGSKTMGAEEGELTLQFDNFKITRVDPINN